MWESWVLCWLWYKVIQSYLLNPAKVTLFVSLSFTHTQHILFLTHTAHTLSRTHTLSLSHSENKGFSFLFFFVFYQLIFYKHSKELFSVLFSNRLINNFENLCTCWCPFQESYFRTFKHLSNKRHHLIHLETGQKERLFWQWWLWLVEWRRSSWFRQPSSKRLSQHW